MLLFWWFVQEEVNTDQQWCCKTCRSLCTITIAVHYYYWCWCYYYHRTRRGRRAGRALTSGGGVRVPEPGPPLWRPYPVPSLKRNCTHLHRYRVSKMEIQRCLAHHCHWVHALETAEILPTRPSHQSDLTSTSTIYILKLMWKSFKS